MEFIQFHPTCLYHPQAKSFLISEAVRGEGGLLRRPDGSRFMPEHDAREELAPRDIVARAIDFEMKKHGLDCVFLDISHKPAELLESHFPNILARCLELGIDITQQPIPVVPAVHFSCGGIVTDLQRAPTSPASTQSARPPARASTAPTVWPAIRSSNAWCSARPPPPTSSPTRGNWRLPQWDESRVTDADESIVISHNWDELRRFMWDYVGIVRTNKRLQRAQHRIRLLAREIDEFYSNFRVSNDLIELRNLVVTADLIVRSALQRKESRGLHFSRDYPQTLPKARDTVLRPPGSSRSAGHPRPLPPGSPRPGAPRPAGAPIARRHLIPAKQHAPAPTRARATPARTPVLTTDGRRGRACSCNRHARKQVPSGVSPAPSAPHGP
jgi:L-aspartate oxidase